MKGGRHSGSKAVVGLLAVSVAAVSAGTIDPGIGRPPLSWLFAVALGGVVFLVVLVLGLSLVGGPDVPRRRRR